MPSPWTSIVSQRGQVRRWDHSRWKIYSNMIMPEEYANPSRYSMLHFFSLGLFLFPNVAYGNPQLANTWLENLWVFRTYLFTRTCRRRKTELRDHDGNVENGGEVTESWNYCASWKRWKQLPFDPDDNLASDAKEPFKKNVHKMCGFFWPLPSSLLANPRKLPY